MWEYSSLANEIFRLQIPYEVHVSGRFADAGFVLFDTNALLTDIFNNPSEYLNGTTPLDVTNPYHQCNITTGTCVNATGSFDSYFWYVIYERNDKYLNTNELGGTKSILAFVSSRLLQTLLSILLKGVLIGLNTGRIKYKWFEKVLLA
jgi:hypothetical protein